MLEGAGLVSTTSIAQRRQVHLEAEVLDLMTAWIVAVADLDASLSFYEKLGFEVVGGGAGQGWPIVKNGAFILGLFHGMFLRNILTFNPGLTNGMERLASFGRLRRPSMTELAGPFADRPSRLTLTSGESP